MRKLLLVGLLALLLGSFLAAPVLAAEGKPPIGVCPPGFHSHHLHGEDMEHHDHHVGLKADLNGNLMICVKHAPSGQHVHVDDVIPTR